MERLCTIEYPLPRLKNEVSLAEICTQDSQYDGPLALLLNLFIERIIIEQRVSETCTAYFAVANCFPFRKHV